jgi:predicted NBD/HSP70 family sugar kinase
MTALQAPVTLENDTAVVALGEAQYGAGKGFPILAYITVSTGVGGARLVQGTVDQNTLGFEPGHQLFSVGDAHKPDMPLKSAENILSGTAMQQRFGKPPREITDPTVWEEYARWLAILINNTLVYWSPDALIVGGSMVVGDPAIPLESSLRYLREIMTIFPNPPFIAKAQLRDEGGLYGALALIRQNTPQTQ